MNPEFQTRALDFKCESVAELDQVESPLQK